MMKVEELPNDAFVELDSRLIDEGKFLKQLDSMLRRAYHDLMDREKSTGDPFGKAVLKAKITLRRAKSQQYFDVEYEMIHAVTPSKRTTLVKGVGERLICPAHGSSEDDPAQLRLFDINGDLTATINPKTGELLDEDVPLKIGSAG